MCGICGIWNYRASEPVDRGLLDRMTDSMTHRGPDDRGVYLDDAAGVGLGFRRLAIIDLSPAGHQPMGNEDGSVWVMLNGEIYNFPELRPALESRGHVFRSRSDTEVIIHQYEERGPACVEDFNGMFGLAIWDGRKRRLVLARDRVGKKPLYYFDDGKRLIFASELKAILQDASVPRRLDPAALEEYLRVGYVGSPRTIFQGIRKLEPGHVLVHDGRQGVTRRYWDWLHDFDAAPPATEEDAVDLIRSTLREAVQCRLVSDVPLGAFLSGGVDSSAVVATMAGLSDRPVRTFSIGFENEDFNELVHAREVAKKFRTEHHEYIVKPESLSNILPRLARQFDEPFADSSALPAYYVSKMARQEVTVCLSGDGGDETMAGYLHYANAMRECVVDGAPLALRRPLLDTAARLIPPFVKGHRFLHRMGQTAEGRYACQMQTAYPSQVRHILAEHVVESLEDDRILLERVLGGPLPNEYLSRMQYADVRVYLPEDILVKVDRTSMLNSLEVRCPLLDHRFLAVAAAIPASWRMRGVETKHIFKKALRGIVPDVVMDRPKMGFSIPGGAWLGDEARGFVRAVLMDRRAVERGLFRPRVVESLLRSSRVPRPVTWHLVWSLVIFELWCRSYLDAEA